MFPTARTAAVCAVLPFVFSTGCKAPEQASMQETKPAAAPAMLIDRLDPALDAIIPHDAALQQVASGFTWTEGPVWIHPKDLSPHLMFADIPSNSIRTLEPDGKISIWLQPSGYRGSDAYGKEPGTNGMTLDEKGRLTVAGHAARSIMRFESMDPHGTVTVLADSYQGKKLNSPNDVVYGRDGSLYFTDPPYGLRTQSDQDPQKELPFNGVYRIPAAVAQKPATPPQRAKLQLLVRDLPRPNGIALSPDNKWLYVADSGVKKWMRYPVKTDGAIGEGTLLLDASTDPHPGTCDGMKVDLKGNIYATAPGGVWILSPEGKHLGTIHFEKRTANLAWGGANATTLYITASDAVYTINTLIPGLRP